MIQTEKGPRYRLLCTNKAPGLLMRLVYFFLPCTSHQGKSHCSTQRRSPVTASPQGRGPACLAFPYQKDCISEKYALNVKGVAAVQHSMEVPQKIKHGITVRSCNSTSGQYSPKTEIRILKRYLCTPTFIEAFFTID